MASAFADRHVVVTGAGGALGSAVVEHLAAAGAVCHAPVRGALPDDRFPPDLRGRVHPVAGVDLGDEAAVRSFYEDLPRLWASIHCAGGFDMGPITETTASRLDELIAINLRTAFLCCRESARRLRSAGAGGRIVNVAARPALEPRLGAGMAAYAATKAGVAALTAALGEELAGDAIWVNAVAPSILDTPANRRAMPDARHDAWVRVEDVAAAIAFLASPDNRVARGGVLPVYGRS